MHVRALRRVGSPRRRILDDLHFKTYRQSFRRIARRHCRRPGSGARRAFVFSWYDRLHGVHAEGDGKVSAVDAEFFVREKGEAGVFACGVFDFAEDNVSGQIHL